jgi:probable F420-dependent oxidoreductase
MFARAPTVQHVKFGIAYANTGEFGTGAGGVALARLAEDLGFESLWTVEHVVVPAGYQSTYPYSPTGRMPGGEDAPIPDPLTWLAFVAGATTTIRLATGILILPQRNPLVLAKEVATLDAMSGGRVELGVGVGWLREEFDALGVPWEARGARTDEYVDVLRRVWREEQTAYDGRFTQFAAIHSYPKPAQAGGPKIHIGGHTEAAARRAGRIGDGFFPGADFRVLAPTMRAAAEEAGRDPDTIEITGSGAPKLETVEHLTTAGVARFVIPPFGITMEQAKPKLERFANEVIAKS